MRDGHNEYGIRGMVTSIKLVSLNTFALLVLGLSEFKIRKHLPMIFREIRCDSFANKI